MSRKFATSAAPGTGGWLRIRLTRVSPVIATALLLAASIALANDAHTIFAQQLIDEAKAVRPDVVTIGIHAKPPGESSYVIIAHTNMGG